jgi:protocatechuate 3,4-dioxygenase beta subunit
MRHKWIAILFLFASVALAPAGLRAQLPKRPKEAPSSLEGTVVSASGAPVANARILWQASDGGKPHVLRSDAEGHFHIVSLRPGLYDLQASAKGVSSEWSHNVLVRPGSEASVSVRLTQTVPTARPAKSP